MIHRRTLRSVSICIILLFSVASVPAQRRKAAVPAVIPSPSPLIPPVMNFPKSGPRPYKEIITDKAVTQHGLFTVHHMEDKWYFEIPDSVLGRDILVVNRLSKAAAGMRNFFFGYAGDEIGNNVIRFERGPQNRIFLKKISYDEMSKDSTKPMYRAVMNSNIQPIVQAFEISALSKDSSGVVIDATSFINSDNDVLNFENNAKRIFQVGSLQSDKSYINSIRTYPVNVEIKTVKTYSKGSSGAPIAGLPVFSVAPPSGNLTVEINSSLLLLPGKPMQPRYFDSRVGYFTRDYIDFDADPQGVKSVKLITRWRLEPKPEDIEKYKAGQLVEPKKQIVYYIDPATPKKWVPYLIQGVNDWQAAFEKAGFKNAIVAKLASPEDSTWSMEDARFSAIVYKPSDVENASGPHIHDPRTGEILESHINWYHNVMKLLHNWYFVQTAAVDPRARKMEFDDSLMGQLIRFVSSHEVGHTLGLRHNFGSSSTVPVENLRNKKWLDANGHTPSIMDYARFNYVAQPEDNIPETDLFPRIGDYDKWAIEWGYKMMPNASSADDEKSMLNKMTSERLKNRRLFFGTESDPNDPHDQSEDLGDNAMKAGAYGIKNLKRIVPNLKEWTKEPNEDYSSLDDMYDEVVFQFTRYMGHAAKNIGGTYVTPKTVEQSGAIYELTPKATQREAVAFLNTQLFQTPTWLINKDIVSVTGNSSLQTIATLQENVLNRIVNTNMFTKMLRAEAEYPAQAYPLMQYLADLKKGIFTEIPAHQQIDIYRRGLQRTFVEKLGATIGTGAGSSLLTGGFVINLSGNSAKNSDIYPVVKGFLRSVMGEIKTALPGYHDEMMRQHLLDLNDRIDGFLNPKKS